MKIDAPGMLNDPEIYFNCGYACGEARKHKDESLAKFQIEWFNRAKGLEQAWNKHIAQEHFDMGYREGRGPIPVEPFK